jgi:membrane-associated phospholipid phosphatase
LKLLRDVRCRALTPLLFGVMLLAWRVQEVRAEPAAFPASHIRLSQWLDSKAEHTAPDLFRAGGLQLVSSAESQPEPAHESVYKTASKDLTVLSSKATTPEFWRVMLQIVGISLVSSIADKPIDNFAVDHGNSGIMPEVITVGNSLPYLAIAYSATMFLTSDEDSMQARTSYSALAAGGVGVVGALGLKYMVGRARPNLDLGPDSFTPFSTGNRDTSWPSIHTTVMWAMITPYAKAYDAPWLYGVAAVTNVARIMGREHWFSDTVAGSLLGYAIGDFMWELHQDQESGVTLDISPGRVALNWSFD